MVITLPNSPEWTWNYGAFPTHGSLKEQIVFCLKAGILAPSTHNSQPWLFKIHDNICMVSVDESKYLKIADPDKRYLHISVGCCIENIALVATYFGILKRITYVSDAQSSHVCDIEFKPATIQTKKDKSLKHLVTVIPKRVNSRGVFDPKRVSPLLLNKFRTLHTPQNIHASFIEDPIKLNHLYYLSADGIRRVYKDRLFRKELADEITTPLSQRRTGIPTLTMRLPPPLVYLFPLLAPLVDISETAVKVNGAVVKTAPMICVISAKEEKKQVWLECGRLFQRISLEATAHGYATSVVIASLEKEDLREKVRMLAETRFSPQFLFTIGFMNIPQIHTPRVPLQQRIIS